MLGKTGLILCCGHMFSEVLFQCEFINKCFSAYFTLHRTGQMRLSVSTQVGVKSERFETDCALVSFYFFVHSFMVQQLTFAVKRQATYFAYLLK